MFNLKDYSVRLAQLYIQRRNLQINLSHAEQDLDGCQLALTPAEGWPGKNEEARATARAKAYAEHETHLKIRTLIAKLRDDLSMLEGEIEAQEVQFKAARWQIRQDTNDVLRQRRIDVEPEDAEGDDPADVTTAVTDEAAYAQLVGAKDDSEFPF